MLGGKGNLSIERMSLQIISALPGDCEGDWCLWLVIKSLQLNNKSVMVTLLILMKVITSSSARPGSLHSAEECLHDRQEHLWELQGWAGKPDN